jgi:hypothetical protein
MEKYDATWRDAGRLAKLETDFSGGVYLFVHEGPPRRIIYVGTAKQSSGFSRRWCQHLSLFAEGGRTVWRPRDETDVYKLMTIEPEHCEPYCRDLRIWMPGTGRQKGFFEPLFPDSPTYEEAWKPWVLSEYLSKVSVWRCTLPCDKLSVILESKIQLGFRSRFDISYYRASGVQSWLGRVEITNTVKLASIGFRFAELPLVEDESQQLLAELPI